MAAGFGFSYLEVAFYTALGGILGVVVFVSLAESIKVLKAKYFPSKKKKRVFTYKNRMIVKVKRNFGLAGIAFISPWLLSVPIGTLIACSMYRDRRKVFLYQSLGIIFWSFGGAAIVQPIAQLFHA